MKRFGGVYTQRLNKAQKTDGALFRGRFKAILVEENECFFTLSRYIHLNPVTAQIVKNQGNVQGNTRSMPGTYFKIAKDPNLTKEIEPVIRNV